MFIYGHLHQMIFQQNKMLLENQDKFNQMFFKFNQRH
jgi:hypothetical protein